MFALSLNLRVRNRFPSSETDGGMTTLQKRSKIKVLLDKLSKRQKRFSEIYDFGLKSVIEFSFLLIRNRIIWDYCSSSKTKAHIWD